MSRERSLEGAKQGGRVAPLRPIRATVPGFSVPSDRLALAAILNQHALAGHQFTVSGSLSDFPESNEQGSESMPLIRAIEKTDIVGRSPRPTLWMKG